MQGKTSYKSWRISEELWEAVKDEIPKRQRSSDKEYKRKPGAGSSIHKYFQEWSKAGFFESI